jgi:hypothetical protein
LSIACTFQAQRQERQKAQPVRLSLGSVRPPLQPGQARQLALDPLDGSLVVEHAFGRIAPVGSDLLQFAVSFAVVV